MNSKKLISIGLLGAIAVALGALGAHFLKGKLSTGLITPDQLNGFDTAVKYQMYHVLAMFGLFLFSKHHDHKLIGWAYSSFLIGICMFSGSLYFLCTRHLYGADWLKVLGPVTPIGGLFFIAGWIFIALIGFQKESKQ
ncbi:MAG: hypothetical protein K0S53_978 [Bacteroidetes bacterium]|jgi:uncharacterized membrane protein YgdD (TMEM256/DUF423 family)|nr:hypothetical protein [Bacteroidota bacterium]